MSRAGQFLSITECGAQPGSLCTESIQQAIDRVASAGGGTVLVPDGTFLSGTLRMRTGVTLLVRPNAVLKASENLDDFPEISRDAEFQDQKRHFILAEDEANITITGGGALDGSGPAFWEGFHGQSKWIKARQPRVHPMLELRRCTHVVLDDIRIRNSPGWTVHPYCCDDVTLRGVRLDNDLYGPNTDGFDINGCRDVFISDCKLSCGDDGIILKATESARSTERVVITNCVVRSNCIGIGLGQETESGIRQVAISNCVLHECNRMFSIGIWAGGFVEDVTVTGCVGDTHCEPYLSRPIHIEVKQHAKRDHVPLGTLRNVQISNFISRGEGRSILVAQEGTMLENITLRDVHLEFDRLEDAAKLSPELGTEGSSQYANRNLEARKQNAAFIVENARALRMEGLNVTWPAQPDNAIDYGCVWARNVDGGVIDARTLRPFGKGAKLQLSNVDAHVME